jgi:hypothetical protein
VRPETAAAKKQESKIYSLHDLAMLREDFIMRLLPQFFFNTQYLNNTLAFERDEILREIKVFRVQAKHE